MKYLARTDQSLIARWWRDIDQPLLITLLALMIFGSLFAASAIDPLYKRYGDVAFSLVLKHYIVIVLAGILMIGTSLLSPKQLLVLSTIILGFATLGSVGAVVLGSEINGAYRWLRIFGLSIQPSEFIKPAFAVVAGRMFTTWRLSGSSRGCFVATATMLLLVAILLSQPDVGKSLLLIMIWFSQFFLSGLPIVFVALTIALVLLGLTTIYFTTPYVRSRIDRFFDPALGDTFQVDQAQTAVESAGLFGSGLGAGSMKFVLPDSHSDFIFATGIEEMGQLAGIVIVGLFGLLMVRVFRSMNRAYSLFVILSGLGLMVAFVIQAWINMASTLSLIPTKGMTLPLISIGGSAMLSSAWAGGCLLCLTRESANTKS